MTSNHNFLHDGFSCPCLNSTWLYSVIILNKEAQIPELQARSWFFCSSCVSHIDLLVTPHMGSVVSLRVDLVRANDRGGTEVFTASRFISRQFLATCFSVINGVTVAITRRSSGAWATVTPMRKVVESRTYFMDTVIIKKRMPVKWPLLTQYKQSAQSQWQWLSPYCQFLKPLRQSVQWWCHCLCRWLCQLPHL